MAPEKPADESALIRDTQRKLLIEAAPRALVVSIVAAVICYFLLHTQVESVKLEIWLAVNIAITAIRAAVLFHISRCEDKSPQQLKKHTTLLTTTIGLAGVSWGSLILLWTSSLEIVTQLQILLFPVALAAGAVSGYGMWLVAYTIFMLACILPMTLGFLFVDEGAYAGTAAPAILYMAALFVLSKSYHRTVTESIKLQFKNTELIENLSTQNQELKSARDDAEAASRSKSEFLACMSHEIRTPMNGVLGMTELLMATDLSERQKKLSTNIYQSGKSLLHIINDILNFSRNEAGGIKLEPASFSLRESVFQLEDVLKPLAKENNNTLQVEFDDDVPQLVIGDANRLQQILMNLTSNAIKFTEDGNIDISVHQTQQSGSQCGITFNIRDSGIGIDAQHIDKIFESFTQADSSTTRKYGGTGLGLSIVRQIVEAMNGDISVTSEPGKGSCFTLQLPFEEDCTIADNDDENIKSTTPDQPAKLKSLQGLQILVAEDCAMNQIVIEAMLDQMGCDTTIVDNGELAVEAANNNSYEIILMDCQMPVMDGYTATEQIREAQQGTSVKTPILAVTANCLPDDKKRCFDSGMDDFLSKPFEQEQLSEMLLRHLPEPGKQAA